MDRLGAELDRLYRLPQGCANGASESCEAALQLLGDDGSVRALVIEFARSRDWAQVDALYRALQEDLGLPAPAVAVGAHAGYALWLSLAEPVSAADAAGFLAALSAAYLAELPRGAVALLPGERTTLPLLPARDAASGHWSAFIDPGLGALFVDEPWLEMAPNPGQQADMLTALRSATPAQFADAQKELAARQLAAVPSAESAAVAESAHFAAKSVARSAEVQVRPRGRRSQLELGGGFADPASFLLALMNDPAASARQRIAAAKALLPYYHVRRS